MVRVRRMSVPPGSSRESSGRTGVQITIACVAVAAFYAAAYGVRHLQVPVADDNYFYVWAVRFAGQFGLGDPHLAARPAFPLTGSALGAVGGASPWIVSVAFPITMSIGLGLAGAAMGARWRLATWGAGLLVALTATSAVAARLMAGKTENLLTVWLIAAIVVVALWAQGRHRFVGISFLALGATLTEWPFVGAFLAVVVAAMVIIRLFDGAESGEALRGMLWPTILGFGLGLAVVTVWNGTGLVSPIQALPPDFAYRSRFDVEIRLAWPAVTVPLALLGWWASRISGPERAREIRRLFGVWLVLTGLALAVGLLGLRLPTYRAITFALPLALAVAAAPFVVRGFLAPRDRARRTVALVIGTAVALIAVIPATALWYRDFRGRATLQEITEFAAVARYALSQPGEPPPVVVVNRRIERVYFYQRIAADVLPPDRREAMLVFAGTSSDALAGRPTLGSDPNRDQLARSVFQDIRPALDLGAPVLTGRSLDPVAFQEARRAGAPLIGGGAVAILRGPAAAPAQNDPITIVPIPSWWQVMLVAMLWLAILAAGGTGWSMVLLPTAPTWVRGAAAPAFGVSALAVVTLVLSHAGVRSGGPGGVAAVAVTMAVSMVLAVALRRRAGERVT